MQVMNTTTPHHLYHLSNANHSSSRFKIVTSSDSLRSSDAGDEHRNTTLPSSPEQRELPIVTLQNSDFE
jgi:hypothetical protein